MAKIQVKYVQQVTFVKVRIPRKWIIRYVRY